jgi:hypothetical protein
LKFNVEESDRFLKDVEAVAIWVLRSNIEQSESFAEKKVDELGGDINFLKNRLRDFPELGEADDIEGVRKVPIYDGRYSAKWIVNHAAKTVILITLSDSKYPRSLREFQFDE